MAGIALSTRPVSQAQAAVKLFVPANARVLDARLKAADTYFEFIDCVEEHRGTIQELENGDLEMPDETAWRYDELAEAKLAADRGVKAAIDAVVRMMTEL